MAKKSRDDIISMQITPCQRSGLIIIGIILGIPAAIFSIGLYASGIYWLGIRLGFPSEVAGIMSVLTAIALVAGALISTIHRGIEGRWPW